MRKLGLAVAVLFALVASACIYYTHSIRRNAESLRQNAYELSLSTSNPTFAEIQRRFGHQLHLLGCDPKFGCAYEVAVSNRPIAALRIFRYAKLTGTFTVLNGVVATNMMDYAVTDGRHFNTTVHVQIDYWNRSDLFSVDPWGKSAPFDTNGLVMIGYASSPNEKRSVLSFNLSCMARPSGCDTVAELLPTVWQRSSNHVISCRLPNHEGTIR